MAVNTGLSTTPSIRPPLFRVDQLVTVTDPRQGFTGQIRAWQTDIPWVATEAASDAEGLGFIFRESDFALVSPEGNYEAAIINGRLAILVQESFFNTLQPEDQFYILPWTNLNTLQAYFTEAPRWYSHGSP